MASIPSWLWIASGWGFVALGAWTVFVGRFRRSRHGRRLCRWCRYDMGATPSLTCPECGRVAKDERELSIRPVSKRLRVAGVGLLVVGWLLLQIPAVVLHGWAAGVPGPLLARVAPLSHSGWSIPAGSARPLLVRWNDGTWRYPVTPPPGVQVPVALQVSDALFTEIWRRIDKSEISATAGAAYFRRLIPISLADKARAMPAVWCAGERAPILPSFGNNLDRELRVFATVDPATAPAKTMHVTYALTVGRTRYILGSDDLPVDVRASRAAMMEVVDRPEINAVLADTAAPRIARWSRRQLILDEETPERLRAFAPMFFRVHTRLLLSGLEIGHADMDIPLTGHAPSDRPLYAEIVWEEGGELVAKDLLDEVAFEFIGDAIGAADLYLLHWNEPPRAWGGRVTIPPHRDLLKKPVPPPTGNSGGPDDPSPPLTPRKRRRTDQ